MKTTSTLNQIFRNFCRLQRSCFSALFLLLFLLSASSSWSQIAQRGSATTASSATTNNTTITINKPSGVVAGDVLLFSVVQNETDNDNGGLSSPTLSGWTLVKDQLIRAEGTGNNQNAWFGSIYYRVSDGSEGGSFTFAMNSRCDMAIGSMVAFSGVACNALKPNGSAGGPFDITPGNFNNADASTATATGVTVANNNSAVIMFAMCNNDRSYSSWSNSQSELFDNITTNGDDASVGSAWLSSVDSGSTGNRTVTLSSSDRNSAILLVLRRATTMTVGTASSTPTLCIDTALTNITHTTTGATGIGTATGLPAEVTAAWASNTITISGTPTNSGTFTYSIPLVGSCAPVNATGTITVTAVNTVGAPSSSPTLCQNTALTNITHTTVGATGIGSATGLPSGVTPSWASNTITISGTPTASGTFNYSIPLTGGCGSVNATGTITVTALPVVTAEANTTTFCGSGTVNFTGTTNITSATSVVADEDFENTSTYTAVGGSTKTGTSGSGDRPASASFVVSPSTSYWVNNGTTTITTSNFTGLQNGAAKTVAMRLASFSIGATNNGAEATDNVWVDISLDGGSTYSREIEVNGGASGSTHWGFSTGTGVASVTYDGNNSASVFAPTGSGARTTDGFSLLQITIPTSATQVRVRVRLFNNSGNEAWVIDDITVSQATLPTYSWTSVPSGFTSSLKNPTGVSVTTSTNYTLVATDPSTGCSGSDEVAITVTPTNTVSAGSSTPTLCVDTALTNITHTTTGATGIGTATGLPSGVTAEWTSNTITISGTPTASGTFTYTIPLTGGCGSVNATGTITVTAANTAGTASSTPTLCVNTALTNITIATTGATGIGTATGLPAGVTAEWASNTITISGTPTASGTFNYSIPLIGGCGSVNATGIIAVNSVPTATDTTICPGGSGSLSVTSSCTDITEQTSGPNNAGTGANLTGVGSTAWSNPGNITSVGSPYATVAPEPQGTSNYLLATNYGFSIPANAIINGIQLTIQRSSTQSFGTGNRDNQVRLLKNNVLQATDKGINNVYPTSLTSQLYGNDTDLWGTTWTADDINNSGFGAVLSVFNTRVFDNATATVNFMQITVTYKIPGSLQWYTVSSGGTAIGSGSDFNPVGVANSGLENTNTAGTTSYWVACSTAVGSCRTKADFIINPAPTVTSAAGNSKTYTGIANATTVSAVASDGATIDWYDASTGGTLLASGTLTYAPTAINVGTYTVYAQARNTISGCTSVARTSATLTINRKALTVTAATTANKVYDGTTTSGAVTPGTLSGFVGTETVTATATGAYSDANVGTGKTATVTYTLANGTNGGLATNYSLASGSATGNITAKALTIGSPTIASKVYDGTTASGAVTLGTLSGFVGTETVTATATGAYSDANVGTGKTATVTYTLVNGTNGGLATNYSLASGSATGNITAKTLTIGSPTIASKVYDGTTASGAVTVGTLSGFVGTETVTATATGAYSDANVGTGKTAIVTYTLANGTNGGLATNYSLASGSSTGNITAKALTVTGATTANKVYDGTNTATVTGGALVGIVGADVVTLTQSGTFGQTTVGTAIAITSTSTLAGAAAGNYSLTQPSLTVRNITAKALTVTGATTANKEYDRTNTASVTGGSLVGIIGADVVALTQLGTFGQITVGTNIAITSTSTISGADSGNYSLTQPSLTARNITAKALTVTGATTANKEYDRTNTASVTGGSLVGIIVGDVVTLTQSGTFGQIGVGTNIAITSTSTISGGDSGNYTLTQPSLTVRNITPKAVTVVADAKSKTYGDDNPALTAVVSGTVNGDVLDYALATTALKFSSVTTYPIAITLNSNPNYSVTPTNALLTVGQKAATIIADAKSKTYGDDNPALTAVVSGTVNGDVLDYALATTALKFSSVTTYPIAITLNSNPNYSVTKTDALLTVGQKAVTVIADAKSKTYGDDNPALTAIVSGTVNGDVLDYALATTALKFSSVTTYPIAITLNSNPNYSVTKTDALLTVGQKAVTVIADAKSKTYGDDNPALTAVVSGTVNGDVLDYALATTALKFSSVTTYPIAITLNSNPNYSVTKTDALLTVGQKAVTVIADAKSKTYGDDNPALTAIVSGTVNGDVLDYALATTALKFSSVTTYPIAITLNSNPNYSVTPTDALLTVGQKAVTVVADAKSKTYGDDNPALTAVVSGTVNGDVLDYALATTALKFSSVTTYPIAITLNSNPNYSVTKTDALLTVEKANQVITWSNPSDIVYGTALSTLQLNAEIEVISGGSAAGALTYAPVSGTVLNAGLSQDLRVDVAATENYNAATKIVQINVAKAATVTTVSINGGPFTYTGSAQTPATVTVTGVGGLSLTPTADYANNTNAGTATASYTYVETANYLSSSDSEDFTIAKAASTTVVTINGGPFTYTGSAQTPATVTVTGAGGLSLTPTADYANNINAGMATASYTFAGDANHEGSSDSEDFTIVKAASTTTITINGEPFTYTGLAQTPATVTVTGAGGLSLTPTADFVNNINAGTATASYTFAGDANHEGSSDSEDFTILKAASITTVTINGGPFTYTGLAQTPATVTVTGAGGLSLTPTADYANNINAGTAIASYIYGGDANHEESSDSIDFTIGKANSAITVIGDINYTYMEFAQGPDTSEVTGSTGNVSYLYVGIGATNYGPNVTLPTNAGTYQVVATVEADDNHFTASSSALEFTIEKASSTITVLGDVIYTYAGSAQGPDTSEVIGSTGDVSYVYQGTGDTIYGPNSTLPSHAGTYQVAVTVDEDDNHFGVSSDALDFTIEKAELTITANEQSKCVGSSFSFANTEFSVDGLMEGDLVNSASMASSGSASSATVTELPYSISISDAVGSGLTNYNINYVDGLMSVTPLPLAGTIVGEFGEICPGGSKILTNNNGVGSIQWEMSSNDIDFTPIEEANASEYEAVVSSNTYFRVVRTSGTCDPVISPSFLISVDSETVVGTISGGNITVCSGTNNSTVLTIDGSVGSVQWMYALTSGGTYRTIWGQTGKTLVLNNFSGNRITYYFAKVSLDCSTVVYTDKVTITVLKSVAGTITGAGSLCLGNRKTLTLSGSVGKVQWQSSTDNSSFIDIVGATNTSYITDSITETMYYRAVVTNGDCESDTTQSVAVTINAQIGAGTISEGDMVVCKGSSASLNLTGNSSGVITWYKSVNYINTTNAVPTWTVVTGQTTAVLNSGSLTVTTWYKAKVDKDSCSEETPVVKVTVNPTSIVKTISGAGAICSGGSKMLTLAIGSVGTLQWQSSIDNGVLVPFTDIVDATSLTYSASPTITTWYRVVSISGVCSSAMSVAVAVTVSQPALVGDVSATKTGICSGGGTTLSLSSAQGSIVWQKATVANGVLGAFTTLIQNTASVTTGNTLATTHYRVVVSNGVCPIATSNAVIVAVSPTSVVKKITGAGAICNGTSRELTLGAGSIGSTQWQSNVSSSTTAPLSTNVNWTNIEGATNVATYSASPTATTWYRVVATSGHCSSIASAAVVVTVSQPTSVGTLSAPATALCTGTGSTLSLTGATGTIAWQKATVSAIGVIGAYTAVSGNTTTTLATGNLTASTAYRVVVSSGVCTAKTSNVAIVTISPAAKVTAITGFNTVTTKTCVGTQKILTLGAGYVGIIEWLSSPSLTGTYTVIPGATSPTYNYTPTGDGVMYFKVRTTSSPCSAPAISTKGVAVYTDNCSSDRVITKELVSEEFKAIAYPNPSASVFQIEVSTPTSVKKKLFNLQVFDMTGRFIEQRQVQQSENIEIGSDYPTGMYSIIVTQGDQVKTLRVIKK